MFRKAYGNISAMGRQTGRRFGHPDTLAWRLSQLMKVLTGFL